MLYSVLAVGDVVGEAGLAHLERHLRPLQKLKNISFTVVNGENASGVGLTEEQAWRIRDAGADAVTLGNHAFGKTQIAACLDETSWLLRPANLSGRAPGHGDHRQGLVVRQPCAGDGPGAAAATFARTGPLAVRPRGGAYAGVFDPV